jgi:hypothetical protein
MKTYETFELLLEQFTIAIEDRGREILRENLNFFFNLCRKYYSTIEHTVKQDLLALKILVRMLALLPLNRENMTIGSEAARLFASIVLKTLSNNLQTIWTTITGSEWPLFREGLITLYCIILHHQGLEKETDDPFRLLSMIPDEAWRQETAMKLVDLLRNLQCSLPRNQEVMLYTLVGNDNLTLEHLQMATSLETYISYLTQFIIAHQEDYTSLEEKIQIQLNKLLGENHFRSKQLNST